METSQVGGMGDEYCSACPMKLNEHARKVDNAGSLNLMTCFGVEVAGERAWLCSACRRNYGRHKSSGGTKRYLMTADKREARMRRHIRKRRKMEAMAAAAAASARSSSYSDRSSADRAERASSRATTKGTKVSKQSSPITAEEVVEAKSEASVAAPLAEPITTPRDHGLTGPVLLLDTLTGRLFAPSGAIRFGDAQPTSYTSYAAAAAATMNMNMNMNMMLSQYRSPMYHTFKQELPSSMLPSNSNIGSIGSLISIDNGVLGAEVDAVSDIIDSDSILIASPSSSSIDESSTSSVTSPSPTLVPSSPIDDSSSSSSTASSPVHSATVTAGVATPASNNNGSDDTVAASLLTSLTTPPSPTAIAVANKDNTNSVVSGSLAIPTSPLSLHPINSCNIGSSMFGVGMSYGLLPLPLLLDQDVDASPFASSSLPWSSNVDAAQPFTIGTSVANKSRASSSYKPPLVKTASLRGPNPITGAPVSTSSLSSMSPFIQLSTSAPMICGSEHGARGL